jgi:hypothetical protein
LSDTPAAPATLSLAAIAMAAVITDRNRDAVVRNLLANPEKNGQLPFLASVLRSAATDPPPSLVATGDLLPISGVEVNADRTVSATDEVQEVDFGAILIRVYRIASGVNVVTAWFCLPAAIDSSSSDTARDVWWRMWDAASPAALEVREKCERWMGRYFPRVDTEEAKHDSNERSYAAMLLSRANSDERLHARLVSAPMKTAELLGGDHPGDLWNVVSVPPEPYKETGIGALLMASSQDFERPMLFVGGAGDIRRETERHASVLGRGPEVFDPAISLTGGLSNSAKVAHAHFAGLDQVLAVRAYAAELARADRELSVASRQVDTLAQRWTATSVADVPPLLTQYFSLLGNADELLLELAELPSPYSGVRGKLTAVHLETAPSWRSTSRDLYEHTRQLTRQLAARVRTRHPIVSENVATTVDAVYAHDSNEATKRSIKIAWLAFWVAIAIPFVIFGLESCRDSDAPSATIPAPVQEVSEPVKGNAPSTISAPGAVTKPGVDSGNSARPTSAAGEMQAAPSQGGGGTPPRRPDADSVAASASLDSNPTGAGRTREDSQRN